jgi:hypothetical protein
MLHPDTLHNIQMHELQHVRIVLLQHIHVLLQHAYCVVAAYTRIVAACAYCIHNYIHIHMHTYRLVHYVRNVYNRESVMYMCMSNMHIYVCKLLMGGKGTH